jgi:hypothetical protein
MFDAFTRVVSQADARGEFLSTSQLDALSSMVAESNKRMDSVNRITSNASTIVANAARALFAEQPQLIAIPVETLTPVVVWLLAYGTWKSSYAMLPTLPSLETAVFLKIVV